MTANPDLQVVLGHWGQLLLFWEGRVNSLTGVAHLDRKVSDYLRLNFYITSSGMLSPALLHHALEVTTIDRLLFSTDYPFQRPGKIDIEAFLTEFGSEQDRAVGGGEAVRTGRTDDRDQTFAFSAPIVVSSP